MKKTLLLYFLLMIALPGFSQQNFNIDDLLKPGAGAKQLVHDYAGILTQDQSQTLEKKLYSFDDSTSNQIAVVIVPSLQGKDVADFNVELGRAWGVGGKAFNNGIVLLISTQDRKLNIATGYGLEGAIPDAMANQIIQQVIVPNFKGNDYYRGIDEGTNALMLAAQGKYHIARERGDSGVSLGTALLIFIFIIIVFIIISKNSGGGGSFMSRRGARPFIWPTSGAGGGWISSGGGGGWSGGGGSSGGFGGFGGGGFGGGGASGSW